MQTTLRAFVQAGQHELAMAQRLGGDMAAFAEQTGNTLLEQGTENKKYVFFLKKA